MATAEQVQVNGEATADEVVNTVVDADASVAPLRYFTVPGIDPFDAVEWELRDAHIPGRDGPTFEQKDVEFPKFWSQTATNIVAQKYFRGRMASPERERSVKQMIGRVVDTIGGWGREGGYFATDEEADAFEAELAAILVNQYASFNSPVWFNVGFEAQPQCSACQPWHALVSTPEGMVPIGQLVEEDQVGRTVYDANGITRILAVKANGLKEVFRLTLRNGSFVEATGDHVVRAVQERRTAALWTRVDELRTGMRMHLYPHRAKVVDRALAFAGGSSPFPDEEPVDQIAVAEAALAGWLQADGFVGRYEPVTFETSRRRTCPCAAAGFASTARICASSSIAGNSFSAELRSAFQSSSGQLPARRSAHISRASSRLMAMSPSAARTVPRAAGLPLL